MAIETAETTTGRQTGAVLFRDARSCKAWLKTVPSSNLGQAQQCVLDGLRLLNRATEFAPLDRLTAMELMRDKVALLLAEQRKRYWGKTIPLSASEQSGWIVSNELVAAMETGYRRCLLDADAVGDVLATHAALIMQRIIRYVGLSMLIADFVYRRYDASIWTRLYLQWREAESRTLQSAKVKDSVGAVEGYSSIEQAFVAVLLGQMSAMHELTAREIDFVDAVLKRFAHKVKVSVIAENAAGADGTSICAIDLQSNTGAAIHTLPALSESVRVLDVGEFSRSLRRRIKKLAAGELPASLDLPADWEADDALRLLARLHRTWCEEPGPLVSATVPMELEALISFGISEAHFFMSGALFEQPGAKRELSRQEINDIAIFGRVSDATTRSRSAEFNFAKERWGVIDESRHSVRLMRPQNSARGVAIGRLLGVSLGQEAPYYLGWISAIKDDGGKITISVSMLPGKPVAAAVRSAELRNRANANYQQCFLLPAMEAMKIPESVILPTGLAAPGAMIEIFNATGGSAEPVKVGAVLDRGADFDRLSIG